MTSHGQPSVVPKAELNGYVAISVEPLRAFKLPIAPMVTSSHKRAHASIIIRNPVHSRWSSHIRSLVQNPFTRSHSSPTSSHLQGRSAKRWARSARLHEIKVLRERRGIGGAKWAIVFKDRESFRKNVALGDVFDVSSSSSSSTLSPPQVKASNRAPDELRRPLVLMAVLRNRLEEGERWGGDAWVDTDVDKNDVLVVSERAVVLILPE